MSENAFIVPHTSLILWLGIEFQVETIFFRHTDTLSHFALTPKIAGEARVCFLVSELREAVVLSWLRVQAAELGCLAPPWLRYCWPRDLIVLVCETGMMLPTHRAAIRMK